MSINIALILYVLMLAVFLGGVVSIVYHLVFYQMNHAFSTLTTVIFIVGAVVFFLTNIVLAFSFDWSQFVIIF